MTDAEINKAVAERVMGHAVYGGFTWTLPDKKLVHCGVVDYCGDPAAWGGLLVWLAGEELLPELKRSSSVWLASVTKLSGDSYPNLQRFHFYHAKPGRALAIAALRAYGVAVE